MTFFTFEAVGPWRRKNLFVRKRSTGKPQIGVEFLHHVVKNLDVVGIVLAGSQGNRSGHDFCHERMRESVSVHHQAGLNEDGSRRKVLTQKFFCVVRVEGGHFAFGGGQRLDGQRPDLLPLGVQVVGHDAVVVQDAEMEIIV